MAIITTQIVVSSIVPVELVAANAVRQGLLIENIGSHSVIIGTVSGEMTAASGWPLDSGESFPLSSSHEYMDSGAAQALGNALDQFTNDRWFVRAVSEDMPSRLAILEGTV